MRSTERVIFALGAFGETGQAIFLTKRQHTVAPSSQNFVRITLVTHIPDQLVMGGLKHSVDRGRQLDHPKG